MIMKFLMNWLPRCLVIGFVASVILPAPSFVKGMSEHMFTVWLFRLGWVLVLSVGVGLAFYIIGCLRQKKTS